MGQQARSIGKTTYPGGKIVRIDGSREKSIDDCALVQSRHHRIPMPQLHSKRVGLNHKPSQPSPAIDDSRFSYCTFADGRSSFCFVICNSALAI